MYVAHQCVHPTMSHPVTFSHSLLPLSSCQQEEVPERPTRIAIQDAGVTETQGQLKKENYEYTPVELCLYNQHIGIVQVHVSGSKQYSVYSTVSIALHVQNDVQQNITGTSSCIHSQ